MRRWLARGLFRALCTAGGGTQTSCRDDYSSDFRDARRHWTRFGGDVPVQGTRVLDIGAGYGNFAVYLARQHGAATVVGADIDANRVAEACDRIRIDHPDVADRVAMVACRPDLSDLVARGERFDVVVSRATLEHVMDLPALLAAVELLLEPGGRAAFGWGPLWPSPYGGHITWLTRLPWAHLVFPSDVVLAERRRRRSYLRAMTWREMGLNQLALADYRRAFESSGLRCVWWRENVSDGRAARLLRLAARVPALRDLCTYNVYAVWERA